MPKRIFRISLLLVSLGLVFFGIHSAIAQQGSGGRTQRVEQNTTQYVWQLVSNSSGKVYCEVIVEHEGQPTQQEAQDICAQAFIAPEATNAPGSTPAPAPTSATLAGVLPYSTWKLVDTRIVKGEVEVKLPDIIVYITAPKTAVKDPYVIIAAYEPVKEYQITAIDGTMKVGDRQFHCDGDRCEVPVVTDTSITFWATSSQGSESQHYTADIHSVLTTEGYMVTVSGMTYLSEFKDSCAAIWGSPASTIPMWALFPASPAELSTNKTLHYLAAQLLTVGAVDASDCPGKGFLSPGSPNACGLEKAAQVMYDWQNQFDPIIWQTGLQKGIPPRMMKSLIEQESQFWPGNSRTFLFEFGLAQMNQLGADVILRYDSNLYKEVCTELNMSCPEFYTSLPTWDQAMLRGALMKKINADCPTCQYGVDLSEAETSIPIIAQMLYSSCQQANYILKSHDLPPASYDTMWKFTMVSYHGGYQCLDTAVAAARTSMETVTWETVADKLDCMNAKDYVNNLWDKLAAYETQKPVTFPSSPTLIPTFALVPTAIPPTPEPPVVINVVVYYDMNQNNTPESNEYVNGLNVQVTFADGKTETQATQNGTAHFSISGETLGSQVTISLPRLYREYKTTVPSNRQIDYTFRLEPPLLPFILP